MPFDPNISDHALKIKLGNPLKHGDKVVFTIDNMPYTEDLLPLFTVGVSYKEGQSTNMGHSVRAYPELRADQIGYEATRLTWSN